MKAVIFGSTDIGIDVANKLVGDGVDVTIVDSNADRLKVISQRLDCSTVEGLATDIDLMKENNLDESDIFISITDDDEMNIISCIFMHQAFNIPQKIATVKSVAYLSGSVNANIIEGIDRIINTETETGTYIANIIQEGGCSALINLVGGKVQLRDIFINYQSFFNGRTVKRIRQLMDEDFVIAGVLDNHESLIIPNGEYVIESGSHVYVAGTDKALRQLYKKLGISRRKLRNIVIIGAGNVGVTTAKILIDRGLHISLIDTDLDVCKRVNRQLPKALVIHGDGSDQSVLEEIGIHKADAIICVTDNEEFNILVAHYAKTLGVKRSISRVSKQNYANIASEMGIDALINPSSALVTSITQIVRQSRSVKDVYSVFDTRAEVVAVTVHSNYRLLNEPLYRFRHKNVIVLCVKRGDNVWVPDGSYVFQEGDEVYLFVNKTNISTVLHDFDGSVPSLDDLDGGSEATTGTATGTATATATATATVDDTLPKGQARIPTNNKCKSGG